MAAVCLFMCYALNPFQIELTSDCQFPVYKKNCESASGCRWPVPNLDLIVYQPSQIELALSFQFPIANSGICEFVSGRSLQVAYFAVMP